MTITDKQHLALAFMADRRFATPQEIGAAIGGTKRNIPQGLGRIGGAMAARLVKARLVESASHLHSGFAAYRITGAGRRVIECRSLKATG